MKKEVYWNGVKVGEHEASGDREADIKSARQVVIDAGLYKEPTLLGSMAGQANAFASTAIDLYERKLKNVPRDGSGISPYIVNATFAIEVYLKAMYVCSHPEINSGNDLRKIKGGHDLKALFDNLPEDASRVFLAQAQVIRSQYRLEDGWDIHTCLLSLNKAFEDWRYIYESEQKEVELQAVRYLLHVSSESCRNLARME